MDLFCFASKNLENLQIGVAKERWAVATLSNQQSLAGRITKARRYLRPGAFGLFYCNPTHSFTTPFVVRSCVDADQVVSDVWPESWILPFEIEPLGDPSKQLPAAEATERWPILKKRLRERMGREGVSAAMNLTGTTVFVRCHLPSRLGSDLP